ncbi:LysR family transcriptional regulator [Oceanobacillus jeddahense]|uniref:LysR substrate-binding domain-containing protein n=1 Tax=Oceanobacillus jeddahense TaxID=1462527 RepID=A0ABY5JW77_9BACI|nr:LysR substrate-binding domain-containing protein [Oceanobacillus jeddahense]UUI04633.1 LysR substrate-binding domain-containing protein [Oceanobacillus jeddahense]
MELRQLEYFMIVCKEMHFTRAAEKLNLSQPTLSEQIKRLEEEVGIPLFDRIGKKIALTEAGKILLKHSQSVFFEIEQAEAAIRDLNELQRGKLAIGSLLTCVNYLLPPAIIKFKQSYPNVKLSVHGLKTDDIKNGLLENELDLGITFLPVEEKEFASVPLFTEELTLAVPSGHPIASLKEIDMEKLKNISAILLPESYFLRQLIDRYCTEMGFSLQPILEMTTLESLLRMVSEGVGVTILPEPYLDSLDHSEVVKVKLINPTPQREIGFIYRKNKFICATTQTFMGQIKKAIRETT